MSELSHEPPADNKCADDERRRFLQTTASAAAVALLGGVARGAQAAPLAFAGYARHGACLFYKSPRPRGRTRTSMSGSA